MVFVTAEFGVNWNADFNILQSMAKKCKDIGVERFTELIEGDITKTVPAYLKSNPELKISLLNLDCCLYEPTVTILENLYPRIQKGGILILDDYGIFPGETKAVDEYFSNIEVKIKKLPFAMSPCYMVI